MCWDKGLRLGGDWGKNAFLLEALAVRAPTIIRRFKTRTANLCQVSIGSLWELQFVHTLRLLQYRQAIAVLCRGAG